MFVGQAQEATHARQGWWLEHQGRTRSWRGRRRGYYREGWDPRAASPPPSLAATGLKPPTGEIARRSAAGGDRGQPQTGYASTNRWGGGGKRRRWRFNSTYGTAKYSTSVTHLTAKLQPRCSRNQRINKTNWSEPGPFMRQSICTLALNCDVKQASAVTLSVTSLICEISC